MAKRLILFRHGKSDWQADYSHDRERPLAKRGIKAAQQMGQLLSQAGQCPDLVMTSPAIRAQHTVELAMASGAWPCPVKVIDGLYHAEATWVLQYTQALPESLNSVLLAGHEPTGSTLMCLLMGGGRVRFPTAAMARIDFEVETWAEVQPGTGCLVWLLQPKFFR